MNIRIAAATVALIATTACPFCPAQVASPPGAPKSARTDVLVAGSKVLQSSAPLAGFDVHLDGFHPMKEHPDVQMEAHHYCRQVNEDFAQCVLFDGDGRDANLTGVEYIISEKLFATLPESERAYWHPHNYEILSGQLIAPGVPQVAEHALMKDKMNSYGKTWHLWHSGVHGGASDALPMGDAELAWSFNHDGEAAPGLVERRDHAMKVDTSHVRAERRDLLPLAHPQPGSDALRGRVDAAGQDAHDASGR
jgi:uncharacterized protein DUF1264